MTEFTLRPYQLDMSNLIVRRLLATVDKPFIVQAATGAGKSLVIADVAHKLRAPVLVLQPSLELLQQNHAKMVSYGLEVSIYSASAGEKDLSGLVVMATIGSIKDYRLFAHFRYIIIDEADVVNPKQMTGMYQKFFNAIGCRNIVGLTATPYRIEQKFVYKGNDLYAGASLKLVTRIGWPHIFWTGGIAYKIETGDLIAQGYLAPIKYKTDSDALHGLIVNSTGADYTADSLQTWGQKKVERLADYVTYVDEHCRRDLVFCTSVSQAYSLQGILMERGIAAGVVTADTPAKERAALVDDFRRGDVKHMLNVGVFLAGFDVPELDCIIFGRPTLSPRVWYQAVGRGVRLDPMNPEKVLRVFDLAGACAKIGRVEAMQLGKEDGYKDTLMGEHGRLDECPLYRYRLQRKNYRQGAYA